MKCSEMIFIDNKIIHSDKSEYIQIYFEELKIYLGSIYNYPQGNCHNLVHFGSLVLNQYNILHKKIWIFAPCRIDDCSNQSIKLPDPNGISANGFLSWGFHVALLINYSGSSFIFDYFLDSNQPLNLDNWLSKINLPKFHLEITEPSQYLFHVNESQSSRKGIFNGFFFNYEGFSKENDWLAKGLAINQTAMEFIQNETFYFEYDTDLSKDFKLLVGSINNFECVFRDKSFNKKMTTEFQEKHQIFIAKYRLIYNENCEKWIEKVNRFL